MIISDTGPISNLIQLGLLDLLHLLFEEIIIPTAVATELDNGYKYLGDWRKASKSFIKIISIEIDPLIEQFMLNLHCGEAEAIINISSSSRSICIYFAK
ncbi:MAG: hypothetical protein V1872_03905 [bacterium]